MKILGIDPGLRLCGYSVIEHKLFKTSLIEAGVLRIETRPPLEQRLNQLATDIQSLLELHKPDVVAVEQLYAHYAHPRTAILMGHARGVILQLAAAADARVESYAATKIKKALTGNGLASKSQMQRAIQTTLGLLQPPEPPDVADAIAVAYCCANEIKFRRD